MDYSLVISNICNFYKFRINNFIKSDGTRIILVKNPIANSALRNWLILCLISNNLTRYFKIRVIWLKTKKLVIYPEIQSETNRDCTFRVNKVLRVSLVRLNAPAAILFVHIEHNIFRRIDVTQNTFITTMGYLFLFRRCLWSSWHRGLHENCCRRSTTRLTYTRRTFINDVNNFACVSRDRRIHHGLQTYWLNNK